MKPPETDYVTGENCDKIGNLIRGLSEREEVRSITLTNENKNPTLNVYANDASIASELQNRRVWVDGDIYCMCLRVFTQSVNQNEILLYSKESADTLTGPLPVEQGLKNLDSLNIEEGEGDFGSTTHLVNLLGQLLHGRHPQVVTLSMRSVRDWPLAHLKVYPEVAVHLVKLSECYAVKIPGFNGTYELEIEFVSGSDMELEVDEDIPLYIDELDLNIRDLSGHVRNVISSAKRGDAEIQKRIERAEVVIGGYGGNISREEGDRV